MPATGGPRPEVLAPPQEVLAAFGATTPPRPAPGGQTTSWIAGDVVLKRDADATFQEWLGTTLAAVPRRGFRLAEAVPTVDGRWVFGGWSATRWVAGSSVEHGGSPRWPDVVEAGRAFHRATAALAKPAFLEGRTDWWAVADRLVWADSLPDVVPELAGVAERLRRPLPAPGEPQLIHADLAGNVLLAEGLPPAIIDVSPYWRPPSYAEGIVVADAMCWHDAPPSLGATLGVPLPAVAHGLLFRLVTTHLRVVDGVDREALADYARRYERAADLLAL